MPENTTSIDTPLYSTMGNDPDFGELVTMFVDEMAVRIDLLEAGFRSGNRDDLARTAHQLKGAAGSYGFPTVTERAGELERAIRHSATEETVVSAFQELLSLCRRVRSGGPETN